MVFPLPSPIDFSKCSTAALTPYRFLIFFATRSAARAVLTAVSSRTRACWTTGSAPTLSMMEGGSSCCFSVSSSRAKRPKQGSNPSSSHRASTCFPCGSCSPCCRLNMQYRLRDSGAWASLLTPGSSSNSATLWKKYPLAQLNRSRSVRRSSSCCVCWFFLGFSATPACTLRSDVSCRRKPSHREDSADSCSSVASEGRFRVSGRLARRTFSASGSLREKSSALILYNEAIGSGNSVTGLRAPRSTW
mmetsp:Transcript_58099/g.155293  ORF Transcript_58099/g.155293 Transcript_58099/m.155293 type:complete len:247 (+) Transcript_58099:465-1205(+)